MKNLILLLTACFCIACTNTEETVEQTVEATPSNIDLVKAMYDAFAEGNVEGVVANFADSIVWNEAENFIYADKNPYIGADSIVAGVFARIGAEWEYWNLENKQFVSAGDDGVLVTGRYKGKNKANGKELDAQFAHVWSMKDGKATSFQQYTDTKQSAEVYTAEAE